MEQNLLTFTHPHFTDVQQNLTVVVDAFADEQAYELLLAAHQDGHHVAAVVADHRPGYLPDNERDLQDSVMERANQLQARWQDQTGSTLSVGILPWRLHQPMDTADHRWLQLWLQDAWPHVTLPLPAGASTPVPIQSVV